MKLYDKIWVPNNLNQLATKYMLIGPDSHYPIGGLDENENVIVISIEDLRELCNHMVKEWVEAVEGGFTIEEEVAEDLDKYLESKGVSKL